MKVSAHGEEDFRISKGRNYNFKLLQNLHRDSIVIFWTEARDGSVEFGSKRSSLEHPSSRAH
jgi:hypothetical protein